MNFKEILAEKKKLIWPEVQKYLPKEGPFDFIDVVNEYSRRQGKYGRGSLVLMGCEAFGGDQQKAIRTAAAMQMSEDWILMHDDWEDNSDERRHKPALHKIYLPEIVINAGDSLHVYMWKALIDNNKILDDKTTFRILNEFFRFLDITTKGQHYEMSLFLLNKIPLEELDYEHYEKIVYSKTSEYTIAGPIRLGAIVAGVDDETLEKISEFAIPLGKGFQIRDDLLNVIGKGSVIGKEIGGDIFEGKRTLMLIHLIKNTQGEERKKIIDIIKKKRVEKTTEEVQYIIGLMREKGSIEFAEKKAEEFGNIAKEKFKQNFPDLPNKEEFESAIDFFTMKRDV